MPPVYDCARDTCSVLVDTRCIDDTSRLCLRPECSSKNEDNYLCRVASLLLPPRSSPPMCSCTRVGSHAREWELTHKEGSLRTITPELWIFDALGVLRYSFFLARARSWPRARLYKRTVLCSCGRKDGRGLVPTCSRACRLEPFSANCCFDPRSWFSLGVTFDDEQAFPVLDARGYFMR